MEGLRQRHTPKSEHIKGAGVRGSIAQQPTRNLKHTIPLLSFGNP